ncbi:hypothetical protein JT358_00830 [Micrococcales bacterium 31B]|nr:hypothetical protein [Micrococcales bacterium 31B]
MSIPSHEPAEPRATHEAPEASESGAAPSAAASEPMPRVMSPLVSTIFLVVAALLVMAGLVLAVTANSAATPDGQRAALGVLLMGVGGIGLAAWVVIQVLGRMVIRIMLRGVKG